MTPAISTRLAALSPRPEIASIAGSQMPVLYLSLDTSDDLVDEAQVAIRTDGEGEHSDYCSLNWPGPSTSTVPYTDS